MLDRAKRAASIAALAVVLAVAAMAAVRPVAADEAGKTTGKTFADRIESKQAGGKRITIRTANGTKTIVDNGNGTRTIILRHPSGEVYKAYTVATKRRLFTRSMFSRKTTVMHRIGDDGLELLKTRAVK